MMAPGSQSFAEKWRKRQACRRCRRIKVRCEFDSPDSDTCTRCAKAGVECQLNPPSSSEMTGLRSHRRGAKYAWIETKQVYSESQRNQKIAELEQIIEDAKAEITMLRGGTAGYGALYSPPPGTTGAGAANASSNASLESSQLMGAISSILPYGGNGGAGASGSGVPDVVQQNGWNLDLVRRPDCVQAIVDAALLNEAEAKQAYDVFRVTLSCFYPLPLDPSENVSGANQLEALAYVVAVAATFNYQHAENLVSFLETVVSDRLLVQGQPSLEIARAVIIQSIFIQSCTVKQLPVHLSSAISVVTALDFAGRDDFKILASKSSNRHDVDASRRRVETYLATFIYAASLTLSTGDGKYIKMVPVSTGLCDSLLTFFPDDSATKELVLIAKMTVTAAEGVAALEQKALAEETMNFSVLKAIVDKHKIAMAEYFNEFKAQPVQDGNEYPDTFRTIKIQYFQLSVALQESLLSLFILNSDQDKHNDDVFMSVATELTNQCTEVINSFIQATNSEWNLTKYAYTRTLLAFPTLVRVRLAMWSFGKKFPEDLDSLYEQVRQAWFKRQGIVLDKLSPLLDLIPRFINLHVVVSDGGATALTLRQVLRDAINGVQSAVDYTNLASQDNDNVDPSLAGLQAAAEAPQADASIKGETDGGAKSSIEPTLYPGADASAIFSISLGDGGQTITPSYGEVERLMKELYKEVNGQLQS